MDPKYQPDYRYDKKMQQMIKDMCDGAGSIPVDIKIVNGTMRFRIYTN